MAKIKMCYVLAYRQRNYVRTQFLLQVFKHLGYIKVYEAINSRAGLSRYLEALLKLIYIRIRHKPDVYVLGFRGYEIFWPVRLITIGKPLIFDEFVNPYLWFVEEHKKVSDTGLINWSLRKYINGIYKASDLVLTDTHLSSVYSRKLNPENSCNIHSLYVGTDEKIFLSDPRGYSVDDSGQFSVFFYGTFLPLHGVEIILDAIKMIDECGMSVNFVIAGSPRSRKEKILFREKLNGLRLERITYLEWINYEDIPRYIVGSTLCLGGPFGKTSQSEMVITGKTFQFMAMGKPTIVGRIEESDGFVDKYNSLVVDQGDAMKLFNAIKWAYDNVDKLAGIGKRGRELYMRKFSVVSQSEKVERLLLGVVKK